MKNPLTKEQWALTTIIVVLWIEAGHIPMVDYFFIGYLASTFSPKKHDK